MSRIDRLSRHTISRLVSLGLALLALGLFIKLSWELHEDNAVDTLDKRILIEIARLRTPALNGPAVDITALGSATLLTVFTLIGVVVLWLNRDRLACLYLAVGITGAGIGSSLTKHLFSRPRPTVVPRLVEVTDFSYPSGHSLGATSLYLLMMVLAWRQHKSWRSRAILFACAWTLICAVCFSRLYLGVHYPSDVLSGLLLGSAWVCLLTALMASRPKVL